MGYVIRASLKRDTLISEVQRCLSQTSGGDCTALEAGTR